MKDTVRVQLIDGTNNMLEFCSHTMHGIEFHFVSHESVLDADRFFQTHLKNSNIIKDTQRYNRFIPRSTTSLEELDFSHKRIVHVTDNVIQEKLPDVIIGGCVADLYDKVWFGMEVSSTEYADHLIQFMHPTGKQYMSSQIEITNVG